jgi:hypothetical protein
MIDSLAFFQITKTIAVMDRTNSIAKASSARMERSSANQVIVSLRTSGATEIVIAAICPMKLTVHRDSLEVVTAPKADSNATTTSACRTLTFAMEQMTVATIPMKRQLFAQT